MERFLIVLKEEAKKSIESIDKSGTFYATALKTLKRHFGNAFTVAYLKTKFFFDKLQLKHNDQMSLKDFQQKLMSYYMVKVNGLPICSEIAKISNKSSSSTN